MAVWNSFLGEWEYAPGEQVWFVAGHMKYGLLVVKVTIERVDYTMREFLGPWGQLGYWIDEPNDMPTFACDLYPDKESAMRELEERVEINNRILKEEQGESCLTIVDPDLEKDRLKVIEHMESWFYKWNKGNFIQPGPFPNKRKWEDWFPPTSEVKAV